MDRPPTNGHDPDVELVLDEPPRDIRDEIRDPLPQPLFSWRRAGIVALLVVAGLFVWAAARSGGGTDGGVDRESAIVSYTPSPGGQVLRQSQVGVELEAGYDGRLTIDGVPIPEDQMVGAIDPSSPEFAALPADLREQGPRPNNKHIVMFQPGPGKAITEYDTGTVEITVRYWRISEGIDSARTTTYTIRVF